MGINMRKYLIALLFSFISLSSFAFSGSGLTTTSLDAAGFSKLSEPQKAEILKNVATAAEGVNQSTGNVVDTASKILTFSDQFGASLAATAKSLGIAVNEFARSPVGMLAAGLIIWHIMGGMIIHVVGGMIILVFGSAVIKTIINRNYPVHIEYDLTKRNIFGNHVQTKIARDTMDSSEAGAYLCAYAVVVIVSLITMFTF